MIRAFFKKLNLTKPVVCFVLAASLFLPSCEVGLGQAIDIDAPTVEIDYPPQNAIVRDSFILSGTCNDDTGIKEIYVTVKNTDTNEEYEVLRPKINSLPGEKKEGTKKNWTLEVNPKTGKYNGYVYPDGKYSISVQAVDKSDRKSAVATLSLDIDNTAPVFIVQNPGTTISSGNTPLLFGSIYAINGQSEDDHETGIEMKFYDSHGAYYDGADFKASVITTSGNTEIARFATAGTDEKNREYKILYGEDVSAGKKSYSCSVKVFDNAMIYKKPGDGGVKGGNETSEIFLYDDVYTKYLSKTGLGLTLADFKKILNGQETREDVTKEVLQGIMIDTLGFTSGKTDNRLAFDLNPVSPPSYSISGFSYTFEGEEKYAVSSLQQAAGKSNFFAVVNAGADGTAIKKANLQMWLKGFGNTVKESEIAEFVKSVSEIMAERHEEIYKVQAGVLDKNVEELRSQAEAKVKAENPGVVKIYDGYGDTSSSSQSISISHYLPENGINGGKYYAIVITGFDEDGTEISQESGYYGFLGLATGESPTIEIKSPEPLSFVKTSAYENVENGLIFSGEARPSSSGDSGLSSIEVTITVKDEETGKNVKITGSTLSGQIQYSEGQDSSWTWSCKPEDLTGYSEVKAEEGDGKSYIYSAEFTVYESGKSGSASRDIYVDTVPPTVSLSALNYIALMEAYLSGEGIIPDDTYLYVNGNIAVNGTINEKNLSGYGWELFTENSKGERTVIDSEDSKGTKNAINKIFDTTKYPEIYGQNFDIEFYAEDVVGNRTAARLTDYLKENYKAEEYGRIHLVINQETDKPGIEVMNAGDYVQDEEDLPESGNIFAASDGLIVRVTDDDSVEKVIVTVCDKNGTAIPAAKVDPYYNANPYTYTNLKSGSFRYTLPPEDGIYQIKIKAFDSGDITNEKAFLIGVSSNAPEGTLSLSLNDADAESSKPATILSSGDCVNVAGDDDSKKIIVNGKINSGIPVVKVSKNETVIQEGKDLKTFTDTVLPSGENGEKKTETYILTNAFGQTGRISFNYEIDTEEPIFENSTEHPFMIGGQRYNSSFWYKSTDLSVNGFYKDEGSGIGEVQYEVYVTRDGNKVLAEKGSITATHVTGTEYYKFSGTVGHIEAGTGNELKVWAEDKVGNASVTNSFYIHEDLMAPDITAEINNYETNGNKLEVSGTVSDDSSGVDYIEVELGGIVYSSKDPKGTYGLVLNKADGTWDLVADCSSLNGTVTGKGFVYDVAGNKNAYTIFKVLVDKEKPSVFVDTITPITDDNRINNIVTITGRVTDDNSLVIEDKETTERSVLKMEYALKTNGVWSGKTKVSTPAGNDVYKQEECYSWTYEFDVSSITKKTEAKLIFTCIDAANNERVVEKEIVIDPASDYPVINLTNVNYVEGAAYPLPTKLVTGTVFDDDGDVKDLWVTWNQSLGTSVNYPSKENDNGWVKLNVNNSAWSVTGGNFDNLEDGAYELYFYAIDSKGTGFSSYKNKVTFRYSNFNEEKENVTGAVKIAFDTSAPEVESMFVAKAEKPASGRIEDAKTPENFTKNLVNPPEWSSTTTAGGVESLVYLKVTVIATAVESYSMTLNAENLELKNPYEVKAYIKKSGSSSEVISVSEYNSISDDSIRRQYKCYNTYTYGPFDLSTMDGSPSFVYTANNGQKSGQKSITIRCDNEAPEAEITSPKAAVSGKISVNVLAQDAAGSKISEIKYCIPTVAQQAAGAAKIPDSEWKLISESTTGEIEFVSTEVSDERSLAHYANETYVDTEKNAADIGTGIWKIPFFFCVSDELGNKGYTESQFVKYDKESTKPYCEITYPSSDTKAVSDVINVTGTASCTTSVTEVRVQLDVNNDGQFTEADYNLISSYWTNTTIIPSTGPGMNDWYLPAIGGENWKISINTANLKRQNAENPEDKMGIRAQAFSENGTKGYGENSVRFVDINWNKPALKDLKLVQRKSGSSETPVILEYVKGIYIGSPQDGFDWYLEGTCVDANEKTCLQLVSLSNTKDEAGSFEEFQNEYTASQNLSETNFSSKLTIKGNNSGEVSCAVSARNNSENGSDMDPVVVTLNIDQTAPYLFSGTSSVLFNDSNRDTEELHLEASGQQIDESNNTMQDSNSLFTFGDKVTEAGSGLNGLAFYFVRKTNGTIKVYDSMISKTDLEKNTSLSSMKEMGAASSTSGSFYINEDGLPVMFVSGTRNASDKISSNTLKSYLASYDSEGRIIENNIFRKGTLVKIGGLYRNVVSVNSTKGEISFDPPCDETNTTAEIVMAQIVNNRVKESAGTDGTSFDYHNVLNDDGDGMIETLSVSGTSYTWSASIFSKNIPDGPIEIHVVAIDNAGNTNHGYVKSTIQNSRPRLAKIFLGTDLNGNGKFDFQADAPVVNEKTDMKKNTPAGKEFGEFVYYSCLNPDNGKEQDITDLGEKNFTIKNRLSIIPEFVGGNNSISYTYKLEDAENTLENAYGIYQKSGSDNKLFKMETKANRNNFIKAADSKSQTILDSYVDNFGFVVIENDMAANGSKDTSYTRNSLYAKNGAKRWFAFTFWDATEGLTQGQNSQWAVLKFAANVNTIDQIPPRTHVNPFYWKGLHNNSIYNSQDEDLKMTTQLQGHIELEDDWLMAPGYKAGSTSGIYDKDPKVSGKIVIRGTAYDDVRLDSLWINFDGVELTDNSGTLESETIGGKKFFKAAWFQEAASSWETADSSMENQNWEFRVITETSASDSDQTFMNQEGHQIVWEFSVNSEIVSSKQSKADAQFIIYAKDSGNIVQNKKNISNTSTDLNNKPMYKMDVVPYVTWIETNLSGKDELNPSIYSRSAKGHYQVRGSKNSKAKSSDSPDGEEIVIHGFNLGTDVLTVVNESSSGTRTTFTTMKENDAAVLPHKINIGTMKSGSLEISANSFTVLNNVNYDKAKGTSENTGSGNEYYYNMQANGENNNNLTDDLKIDVWEFKNGAVKVTTELGNPTVRFNPNNGSIGMSFTNGIDFDMPGSSSDKDNGYKNMQYSHTYNMRGTNGFGDTTFAFDKNGYSYGAAQSRYDSGTVGNSGFFRLSLSRYLSGSYSTDNANYGQTGSVWLEANSINTKKFPKPNYSEWQNYQDRIVSPQIVAVAEDAESKKVMLHVAYADTATKQIRYRRSYVNAEIQYNDTYYKNNAGIDYNQAHVLTFDPEARMDTVVPDYFRITALPEGCTDESLIGTEVTSAELPAGSIQNVHYVDVSASRYLAGSSLRNVNDVDSNFQFGDFDLSEMKNDDDSFSDYRFPPKMWAVDFANNRIDQTTTANRTSYGNKPTYPYSTFSQAFAEYNPIMNPDSLQNQAGQTIHVLASSGIEGDVMDVYKKNTVKLTDSNGVTYYQKKKNSSYLYNAGNSVALGVADNGSPIIAWHDNERNRLNISFNTEAELKAAEDNVAALSKKNGGTGGTLYGKKGTYSGTPAYYVCYSYYANTSLTSYIRYYRLYNDGTKGKVEDRDENQFVDKAVYDGNSWSVNTANAYEKIPTGMYATPTTSVKYKVMKLHSSKTRKWKYLTQTTTEVYNASGKLLSSKTEEIERKDDTVRTTYADIDALIFNNSNAIAKGGATVTEWELNGKVIYTPSNRVVQVYDDTTAPADTLKATREISRTTDPDTGNVTVVTQKDIDRDYYDIQSSVEWLTPDLDTKQYHAADKTNVYVSYPVYALYTKTDEFMGCATENTQLSFDRTEVWEGHTKQIGKGGAFVQMQVVDNIVHMAYYDEDTGSLNYTKIPFHGSSFGTPVTYTVDGYNDIGENLTLDVVKDAGGNHIPYIGYFGNKRAKLAYLAEPDAAKLAGSVSDKFTGVWEVLYVPSERSVNADRINVAVRKDASGMAIAGKDTTDSAVPNANNSAKYIYSNATKNPVMGYINASGNLELGQMR